MQTIVVAIIALVILVIVIIILSDKFNYFTQNTATCQAQGGVCASDIGDRCNSDYPIKKWMEGCECIPTVLEDCEDKEKGQCCLPI